MAQPEPVGEQSLSELLGGRRAALDATVPPVAFVGGWLIAHGSLWAGTGAAVVAAVAVALWRLYRDHRPRAVLTGLLGVCVAALIALRTGRAEDFFLLQIVSNAASALVWAVSIVVRWPLLGVVAGAALGQRTRWRGDPALLSAYGRGSWVWVAQYVVRLAVFLPLYAAGQVVALGAARVALTWPLVAASLAGSWWLIRRSLPPGHPGLRHPQPRQPQQAPQAPQAPADPADPAIADPPAVPATPDDPDPPSGPPPPDVSQRHQVGH